MKNRISVNLQAMLVFLGDHATLADLQAIQPVFSARLRHLQEQGALTFEPDEQVLFIHEGVEQPAVVVKISRRFITICLGKERHVRCDAAFLKKIPPSVAAATYSR